MSFNQNQILSVNNVLSELTAIPQIVGISNEGVAAHIHGNISAPKIYRGMVVSNRSNPGAIAYAITPGEDITEKQTIVATINSSDSGSSTRQFDFTLVPEELAGGSRDGQLFLNVSKFNPEDFLSGKKAPRLSANGKYSVIPLVIGPGTVSIAEDFSPEELSALNFTEIPEFDLGGILGGVVKAIPTIADAGLKIYQQLSAPNPKSSKKAEPEIFGGLIGAVASAALPLVGGLLSKL